MKKSASLKVNDRGRRAFAKRLKKIVADGAYVKVGLLGGKKSAREGDPYTNPEIGAIHEFGSSRVPRRPWLAPGVKKGATEYLTMLQKLTEKALSGDIDQRAALALIGQKASADVKAYVTAGPPIPPPNAPSTLERKLKRGEWNVKARARKAKKEGRKPRPVGDVRTLVDTGRMIGAVTYLVVNNGAKKGAKK